MKRKMTKVLKWMALAIVLVLVVLIVARREWIYDFWRGVSYRPSKEMVEIRDRLGLTDYGVFLFNASQPALNDSEEFNEKCRFEQDGNDAIVGCYTDQNIHVYNIKDSELDGIRECTSAHELLHAVWDRMGEDERESYYESLSLVLNQNNEYLKDELELYEENAKREELYVRAGTEIKDLPKDLEAHYAKIFKDQDKVVSYYDKYISVFRNLQAELESLKAEMETIKAQIDTKESDYARRVDQLNKDIAEFNQCAATEGCSTSQWSFLVQRNALISEQAALESLYQEINDLIDSYNVKVNKYNEDVISSNKLNQMINSTAEVEELEIQE